MSEAIKGSIQQYARGLIDSLRGIFLFPSLDKKVRERNQRKQQRIEQKQRKLLRVQDGILSRCQKCRFVGNTAATSHGASIVVKDAELNFLSCLATSVTICSFIWISIWILKVYFVSAILGQAQKILPSMDTDYGTVVTVQLLFKAMDNMLHFLFSALWVLPLCAASQVVHVFWFSKVSNSVYRLYHGEPRAFSSTAKKIADLIHSTLAESIFLVQAMLIGQIPCVHNVCYILFCLHHCLLYALYAFEYKWLMGLDFKFRIQMIETRWPYFCGFGTPLFVLASLTSAFAPTVITACTFSAFFPLFIVSAMATGTPYEKPAARLRLFELSLSVCDALFKQFHPCAKGLEPSHLEAPGSRCQRTAK